MGTRLLHSCNRWSVSGLAAPNCLPATSRRVLYALGLLLAACGGGGDSGGSPPPINYTVGGSVSGLAASGLVLRNNGGDSLALSANGAFTFPTALADATAYGVTVFAEPASPAQTCVVSNASGTLSGANVSNVAVACTTNSYTVGGTVTGLTGSGLLLQDNGSDKLPVSASGSFTFATAVASGNGYGVTVLTQPGTPAETCSISSGSGTVANANVTTVNINCTPTQFTRFAYVSNGNDDTVSVFGLDSLSGQMSPLGTVPSAGPGAVTVDPFARFAFVVNANSGTVSGFSINSATGALTPLPGSPFGAGPAPSSIAVDPTGRLVYVTDSVSPNIWGYRIDRLTGALAPLTGSPFAGAAHEFNLSIDPLGKFVYVAQDNGSGNPGAIAVYLIAPSTGALTPVAGSPFAADPESNFVAVHPTGKFVYSTNPIAHDISAFAVDPVTGALSPVAGSPFPSPHPFAIVIDPAGRFAFVSNFRTQTNNVNTISVYRIDPTTGALAAVAGSPFPVPGENGNLYWGATDPTGQFLYVVDLNGNDVASFKIDANSGAVAPLPSGASVSFGKYPNAIAIAQPPLPTKAAIVYLADKDQVGTPELYRGSTKLNPTFAPGTVVTSFSVTSDDQSLLYIADQDTPGVPELYGVSLAQPGVSTKLNSTLVAGGSVLSFAAMKATIPSFGKVAYIARQDGPASAELYLVDLATPGTSVKLSGKLAAGGVVGVESFQFFDTGTLVYRAQQDSATQFELYKVNPSNPATPLKINPALASGGSVSTYFVTLADTGAPQVIYRATQDSSSTTELYAVAVATPAISKKLNAPLVAGGNVQSFAVAPTGFVYRADEDTKGVTELYYAAFQSPGTATKLNAPPVAGGNVQFFELSPTDSHVAYVANQDSAATFELYLVDINQPGKSSKVNAALAAGGNVQSFMFEPTDGSKLLYLADEDIKGVPELYLGTVASPGVATKLNPPLGAGRAVTHFDFDTKDGLALYLCNQVLPAEVDLFGISPAAPQVATQLNATLKPGGNVVDFAVGP